MADQPTELAHPEVVRTRPGVRPIAWLLIALAMSIAALIATRLWSDAPNHTNWFETHRARCNSVEAVTLLNTNDPGLGREGRAYRAGCLALAGKIALARAAIREAPKREQRFITNFVFRVGHPVADRGDDESAGPIMELVLEFQPDQYMALYHAGMAQAIAGHDERARAHLSRFLEIYRRSDGYTANAKRALQSLERPLELRKVERGDEGSTVY
jgi:hypothetical protein